MTVRLVNPIDQGTAETPVSRAPQTIVSVVGHQSDTTETPVQDSVSAVDCISVFHASFSGTQVLELWPILFGVVNVSEAFGCCASSDDGGTPSKPSQMSLDKRSSSCRNHSSEVVTAVFSRMCPEAPSTSDSVDLAKPDGPNGAVGDPGRRGHQNYPHRWRRGGIRNGRRGAVSCRHELGFARLLGI